MLTMSPSERPLSAASMLARKSAGVLLVTSKAFIQPTLPSRRRHVDTTRRAFPPTGATCILQSPMARLVSPSRLCACIVIVALCLRTAAAAAQDADAVAPHDDALARAIAAYDAGRLVEARR